MRWLDGFQNGLKGVNRDENVFKVKWIGERKYGENRGNQRVYKNGENGKSGKDIQNGDQLKRGLRGEENQMKM